jgi:hypothetical protein
MRVKWLFNEALSFKDDLSKIEAAIWCLCSWYNVITRYEVSERENNNKSTYNKPENNLKGLLMKNAMPNLTCLCNQN